MFKKELLEILTSTAQWGWDYSRDSWRPVNNQYRARMPSLPHNPHPHRPSKAQLSGPL